MKELLEYRVRLIENLASTAHDFRAACLTVKDPFAPLEADGWNTHQIAAHARDVDKLVYGLRARRTLQEDRPEFASFDGDAYAAEHYNANEPLDELLNGFATSIESLVDLLRTMPQESWARESSHATLGGGLTLQTWVERSLAHIEEHLATVKKT